MFPEAFFFAFRFPSPLAPLPGAGEAERGRPVPGPGVSGARCVIRAASGKGRRKRRDGTGRRLQPGGGEGRRRQLRSGKGRAGGIRGCAGASGAGTGGKAPGPSEEAVGGHRSCGQGEEEKKGKEEGKGKKGKKGRHRASLCQGRSPEGAAQLSSAQLPVALALPPPPRRVRGRVYFLPYQT